MTGFKGFSALCLMLTVAATTVWSADPAAKEGAKEVTCKISEEGVKCCSRACTINYRQALGLPLDYLSTLGQRIHNARLAPDPVGLALAARSLAVAEEVSGKKADVTSTEIMGEAVELAKRRAISTELKAVAAVVSDAAVKAELSKAAATAATAEADQKAALASGESTRAIHGTLQVNNRSNECLRIYVDGRYCGEAHSGQTASFHVHAHGHSNHLEAYCEEDGELVTCTEFHGHTHYLTWNIY